MANSADYVKAVAVRLDDADEDLAMLPTLLVVACVDVLPVAGAGLSVMSDIRLPLGSSDATAALAEQLQVTLGSGPCLAAAGRAEPVVSGDRAIAAEWPVYHSELRQQTPYRSVMALPLSLGGYVGALDLYSTDPTAQSLPSYDEVWSTVGEPIAELMLDAPDLVDRLGLELPSWLLSDRVDVRLNVWVAVGMMMQAGSASSCDALALLRAFAYSTSQSLDQVASDLVARRLSAAEVLGGA